MRNILRSAAIIISLIWGFYLIVGWWSYSRLIRQFGEGGLFGNVTSDAKAALIIQTAIAIALFLIGVLAKGSNKTSQNYVNVKPVEKKEHENFVGERNINNDAYQIYLIKKYSIEKNDVLAKFILNDKLFETIDEALDFASKYDNESQLENQKQLAIKEKIFEEKAAEYKRVEQLQIRIFIAILIVLAILVLAYNYKSIANTTVSYINSSLNSLSQKFSKNESQGSSSFKSVWQSERDDGMQGWSIKELINQNNLKITTKCQYFMHPASVDLSLNDKEIDPTKVKYKLDGVAFENQEHIDNDCRACAGNFEYFWNKLKVAKTIEVNYEGKTDTFVVANQATFPHLGGKNDQCKTAWIMNMTR